MQERLVVEHEVAGHFDRPDGIGAVIAALPSDSCRYLTASGLDVSGGFMV